MSARDERDELAAAVELLGALPMPVGPEPQALSAEREAEIREWVEAMGRQKDIRYYGSWQQHGELLGEIDRLRARVAELEKANAGLDDLRVRAIDKNDRLRSRVAELEAELADAVAVSETLNRRLHDEKLAGSALYAALTMPTTPEQRQAALDRFLAVAQRTGQLHGPTPEESADKLTTQTYREDEAAAADRIVAYRDPSNPQTLLCREHGQYIAWVAPVTSEDLPDGGGFCTYGRMSGLECGRDGLIAGPESGGAK